MAIVTLEVPEELLGDLYIAVGLVLRRDAEEEAAEERRRAASGTKQSQDESGAEA